MFASSAAVGRGRLTRFWQPNRFFLVFSPKPAIVRLVGDPIPPSGNTQPGRTAWRELVSSEGLIRGCSTHSPFCRRHPVSSTAYAKALRQLRSICQALPETREVEAWGHPTFRAGKKMFAGFGEGPDGLAIGLKVGLDRQEELLKDGRFFPTPYAAHQGWVSLRVNPKTDWGEVRGLVHEAYRQVALKRMLKALGEEAVS
jgi:predicted DNA-binding protein (MmcQ/YjbR family)